MSEAELVAALAATELFGDFELQFQEAVARVATRRPVAAGDVLWHQGDEPRGMAVLLRGRASVLLRAPGGRTIELAQVGPGEALGELALLDGQPHSATVEVTEPGEVLLVDRTDFSAWVTRRTPTSRAFKHALARTTVARLRRQLTLLAESLGPGGPSAPAAAEPLGDLEPAEAPEEAYVQRMAAFRAVDRATLDAVLAAGRLVRCPRGHVLLAEGCPAPAFCLVVNGTVEIVLARGDKRMRVGLAGPGQAFGYEGLLDGLPSPAAAIARERAVLLVVEAGTFAALLDGQDATAHTLLEVIDRDLAGWLRRVRRPQLHLAVRPVA